MDILDKILNKFTMYKVVLFSLSTLFFISLIFSFLGILFYKPLELIFSLGILTAVCFFFNYIFAKIFKAPINPESSFITALIMFFIMAPISKIDEMYIFVIAGIVAMLSKYIVVINKKHIFNPAAFGLVAIGLAGFPQITWWVGNSELFPFVLVLGLIVVRKIRKLSVFSIYFIFAFLSILFFAIQNNRELGSTLLEAVVSYPVLFLGAFMLVEPLTLPPRKIQQLIYAGIVGLLSGAQYHIGPIYSSPELGLLIGNVYSFFVSFKARLVLILDYKKEIAPGIFEFSFLKKTKLNFLAGQYFEWMLDGVGYDSRGSRRFFTIASSPTESDLKIAVKIIDRGSKFKSKLMTLKKGDKIYANSLAGDFVLSKKDKKFVFMAGGIGITPFRSIIKNAIDRDQKLDAVLFYSSSSEEEFVYRDIFETAKEIGLRTHYSCSRPSGEFKGTVGRLTPEILKHEVPDYKERIFYLSGPNSMVGAYKKILRSLGVGHHKIITDYFSGY